jgi:hypothetical protein
MSNMHEMPKERTQLYRSSADEQTEQAVIMLASHFYESRDGATAGFFADSVPAGQQVWNTVNLLLRMHKNWKF